jgi:hypothetical protein
MFWDGRSTNSVGCLNNLSEEVESMSLSGFQLMIAVGRQFKRMTCATLNQLMQKKSQQEDR